MFGVLLKGVIPAIINFNGTLNSRRDRIATGILLFICIRRAVAAYSDRHRAE